MQRIILCLACLAVLAAEAASPPCGVYASAGSRDPRVAAHPTINGCLVRVFWSDLEPQPGTIIRRPIDDQLAALRAAGKGWSLGVVAGPHAPAWLRDGPERPAMMDISFRGQAARIPCWWDPLVQRRLTSLLRDLGRIYADDPLLRLVYVPQMTANGIEGHFNGNEPRSLAAQGLTPERWTAAALETARSCAQAFPRSAVAIELHDLLGSSEIPSAIMAGITADPALRPQVGVAVWWLSGRTTYQGGLLQAISAFPGAKYGQLIARSDRADSFPAGGFPEAFAQARSLGMRYVEVWETDALSGAWDGVLADYNRWAKDRR